MASEQQGPRRALIASQAGAPPCCQASLGGGPSPGRASRHSLGRRARPAHRLLQPWPYLGLGFSQRKKKKGPTRFRFNLVTQVPCGCAGRALAQEDSSRLPAGLTFPICGWEGWRGLVGGCRVGVQGVGTLLFSPLPSVSCLQILWSGPHPISCCPPGTSLDCSHLFLEGLCLIIFSLCLSFSDCLRISLHLSLSLHLSPSLFVSVSLSICLCLPVSFGLFVLDSLCFSVFLSLCLFRVPSPSLSLSPPLCPISLCLCPLSPLPPMDLAFQGGTDLGCLSLGNSQRPRQAQTSP